MYINIDSLLEQNNKTRYWLSKEIGITYQNTMRLCNNETTSIKFDLLEKICLSLNCTPNDLFIVKELDLN